MNALAVRLGWLPFFPQVDKKNPMELYKDPDNRFVAGFIGSPSMNFLPGTVRGGAVHVAALDRTVPTDVALPADGASVLLGIRPQHLRVSEGGGQIRLDIRERLGGVAYDYLLAPDGTKIIAETRGDEAIPEDTMVQVDFDASDALVFDGKTEQRLR